MCEEIKIYELIIYFFGNESDTGITCGLRF